MLCVISSVLLSAATVGLLISKRGNAHWMELDERLELTIGAHWWKEFWACW